jgi:uncharacterized protein YcbX
MERIGTVETICRYPVKSMAGEEVAQAFVRGRARHADRPSPLSGLHVPRIQLSSQQFFFQRIAMGGHGRIARIRVS